MTTNDRAAPPNLATLCTKPSWHNRQGRVDRSACFVLAVAPLWRRVFEDQWIDRRFASLDPLHAKGRCDRYASVTLRARQLQLIHDRQSPYPLQGDLRTIKANALQAHRSPAGRPTPNQATRDDRILGQGPVNPNRGVGFTLYKTFALPDHWQTNLRIERIIQHAKLRQHFFVCPLCDPRIDNPESQLRKPNPQARLTGRCTKLYLPLCTPAEYADAQQAQRWLATHPHPNRPLTPDALQLIKRYAELFHPRQLRCRHCLALRYGEVKSQEKQNSQSKQTSQTNQ